MQVFERGLCGFACGETQIDADFSIGGFYKVKRKK